ncbi:tetratricopeptide repeat protein [Mucilaginibacter oryzae]|nr:hypothetical protein [Mucilaginibacter oryzae]
MLSITGDYKHCLDVAPQCKRMFLMSSRLCGPKNYKRLNAAAAWIGAKLDKDIYVFDARWMATYIIDAILEPQDITTLELLEPHLVFFEQIRIEFGYSHDLPTLPKDNWARPKPVVDVLTLLDKHQYVQIHGMSGMGKTYLAVQVFNELKKADTERMVIWIPGNTVANAESLSYLKIERYAVPQNILGIIKRFKCVVIIDSLESNVEDVIKRIEQVGATNYRLIVTSQTEAELISVYDIPPSDDDLSGKILNAGLQKACPPHVYQQIIASIGGHPFLLDQINILVKKEQVSWSKVLRETDTLTASTFDNQAFYDRLFVHHLKTASQELGILKWIDAKEIDESLLMALIGKVGIKKLRARNFFNAYRNGAFVLHDIVLNSLRATTIQFDENIIERKLADRLKNLYHDFDPAYYRIIHAHKALIFRLLEKLKKHDIYKYSYLISVPLADYDERIVPATSEEELSMAFRNFRDDDYFLIMSWIEQTEKEFRIIKAQDRDATEPFLTPRIKIIEDLLAVTNRLTAEVHRDIRNHLGKFLRDIDDRARAIQVFESIIAEKSDFWAAKFHLAKLYRKDNQDLARQYLSEIVHAYTAESQISPTIVLASFKEFRSHNELDQLLPKFIDSFEQLLEQTMVSRFDQPYEVLGALASRIQFKMPEKMIALAAMLPIPAEDAIENYTLFDVGMIYLNTGKAHQQLGFSDKAEEFYRQATAYYAKLTGANAFQLRAIAEAYLLLKDPNTALTNLNAIPERNQDEWYHFTLAKTLKMLQRYEEAKAAIEVTVSRNKQDKHISTFHRERGSIRYHLNDPDYRQDYDHAIAHCDDQQFIDIMTDELKLYSY